MLEVATEAIRMSRHKDEVKKEGADGLLFRKTIRYARYVAVLV